jgi:hypothetical protein
LMASKSPQLSCKRIFTRSVGRRDDNSTGFSQDLLQHQCVVGAGEQAAGAGEAGRLSKRSIRAGHSSRRSRDKSTCPVGRAPPPCCCFPAECTPPRGLDAPLPPSRSRTSTSPPKILESREPYIFKTCLQAMAEGRF